MTSQQPFAQEPRIINGEQDPPRSDLGSFFSSLSQTDQGRFNDRVLGKITGEAGLSYDDAVFEVMKNFTKTVPSIETIVLPTADQIKEFADDTPERAADRALLAKAAAKVVEKQRRGLGKTVKLATASDTTVEQ